MTHFGGRAERGIQALRNDAFQPERGDAAHERARIIQAERGGGSPVGALQSQLVQDQAPLPVREVSGRASVQVEHVEDDEGDRVGIARTTAEPLTEEREVGAPVISEYD